MSDEEEQPVIKTSPYASPMHAYGGSIIVMTNPDDELFKMELTFRCMRIDGDGKQVQVGDPLMNELGINSIIGIVQSLVNRVTIMSNLNKYEIPMIIDFLADTLARDLMVNRVNYQIRTSSARDKIFFTTLTTAFVTMKRAFEEGEKRFWKGSQQEITTRIEGASRPKSGLMSSLMGWRK